MLIPIATQNQAMKPLILIGIIGNAVAEPITTQAQPEESHLATPATHTNTATPYQVMEPFIRIRFIENVVAENTSIPAPLKGFRLAQLAIQNKHTQKRLS